MFKKSLCAGILALSLASSSAAPASAVDVEYPSPQSGQESAKLAENYTHEEILQFLFEGTGKVAKENPELLERFNFNKDRPMADKEVLGKVIDEYLDYHPDFEGKVVSPLTSGDPKQVEAALTNLTDTYFDFLEDEYGVESVPIKVSPQKGCGPGGKVCVVAYAVGFVNVAVYANAAAATMAVIGLYVVPSAVSYLMAPDSADGELVKTEFVADLTSALAV